jgi:hypothetical protein
MTGIISDNVARTSGLIKAPAGGGAWTLLSTQTASSSATLSFTSGIDSTYPTYVFQLINIHPEEDDKFFQFNGSDDTSSHSYDIAKTTTFFEAEHSESGSASGPSYTTSFDIASGTGDQRLFNGIGNDNDQSASGYLYLFSPASTVSTKHFFGRITGNRHNNAAADYYYSGYFNTTAAITAIQFSQSSGNIDFGKIKLYGLSGS